MKMVPASNDLVLVCLIPQPRDLEIARVLGWYRIPLKHAPKVVYTDCLAFYQPASFAKGHQWVIEYVAPIYGVELTRRKELLKEERDHPHADEEYYKLSLGTLALLPRPIPASNWKRITFFYTTGELLLRANSIADLIIDHENKHLFQNTIKEYQRKFAEPHPQANEMEEQEREFLQYFLQLNTAVKKDHLIQDVDLD